MVGSLRIPAIPPPLNSSDVTSSSSAVRTNAFYFPFSGEVYNFRRGMAFLATIREGQHRRQSLGTFPCPSEEFGGRRGIQSWTDDNVHEMGSVRRIHIPTSASPLERPSWLPT